MENTRIMALETSGRLGSVALAQGTQLLAQETFTAHLQHAAQLVPAMDRLCRQLQWRPADIEHLYVSAGPGSFTGIRIAVTAAKTLALAQSTRLVAVPSLEALAQNALRAAREENEKMPYVATVLEAGRGRIFAAVFERLSTPQIDDESGDIPGFRIIMEQTSIHPAELLAIAPRPLFLVGEGLKYHPRELAPDDSENGLKWLPETNWTPRAENLLRCGWCRARQGKFVNPDSLTPLYLRRPEAVEKWEKRQGEK